MELQSTAPPACPAPPPPPAETGVAAPPSLPCAGAGFVVCNTSLLPDPVP